MTDDANQRFSAEILPHLDAAFTLAKWLTRNDIDAEDVVQESLVKALRFIKGYQGINAKGWLLTVVRNTAYTWLKKHRSEELVPIADDDLHVPSTPQAPPDDALLRGEYRLQIRQVLDRLPIHLREVLLLREVEEMPYKSIAEVIGSPIGTVMSRLARAREQLSVMMAAVIKEG